MGALLVIAGALAFAFNVIIAPFIYASGSDPLTMIAFRSVVFTIVGKDPAHPSSLDDGR